MSTATLDMDSIADSEQTIHYRALHTGAIVGLVLGIVSVTTVIAAANSLEFSLLVAPIPVLGMIISLRALAKIRREPEHYTGGAIATLGLILSFVFLFGGVAYGGYVYVTELPDGYTRISFNAMKPDELQERSGIAVPPDIAELDGQKVFIKGYIRPDSISISRGIDNFLLVRDNNQCCFGDLSKIKFYDQILVDMVGTRRVDYAQRIFRMGGILRVKPQNLAGGALSPVFTLEADYANLARGAAIDILMFTCLRHWSMLVAMLFVAALPVGLSGCGSKQAGADSPAVSTKPNVPVAAKPKLLPGAKTKALAKVGDRSYDKTFDDIRFEIKPGEAFQREMLPESIESLAGQRIRIRGFILPTPQKRGIKQFVLVRDNQECCFGPGAALYDCILVEMQADETAEFSIRPVAVEGTFDIQEIKGPDGKHLAVYHLVGESVE